MHPVYDLQPIARQFFFIHEWKGANPVGNGKINDTYIIQFETRASTFSNPQHPNPNSKPESRILQRLNHGIFKNPEGVMANIEKISAHLENSGYPLGILKPLYTIDGRLLAGDAKIGYWRVFPFFENTITPENASDPAQAFEAAHAYGLFLTHLRDFPAEALEETIPGFHDSMKRWKLYRAVLKKASPERLRAANAAIMAMAPCLDMFFKPIDKLKKSGVLPLRVTHNDTKAGNVLLDGTTGKAIAVIDWDTVMPGAVLSDFGDMMRTFAPDRDEESTSGVVNLRMPVVEAMIRGFLEATGAWLTDAERQHLLLGAQWIIAEQALRFLTDFLANDVYYPIRYPDHNLKRAENQLALLNALREHARAIEKMIGQG